MPARRLTFLFSLFSFFLSIAFTISSTGLSTIALGYSSHGSVSATTLIPGSIRSNDIAASSKRDVPTPALATAVAFNVSITDNQAYAFCWYPLSGTYGLSLRALFYVSLAFACLARTREWLIGGALAAALTYSGAAAIQACLLFWRGPAYGENDYWALLAILSTSCIVTVPMINWSCTLRKLGATHERDSSSRTIIIWWGFLVSAGFLCCFVALIDSHVPFLPFERSPVTSVMCIPPGDRMNFTAGQDASWDHVVIDDEFIQENRCLDPCRGWPNPNGGSLFRSDDDYRVFTKADVNFYVSLEAALSGQPKTKKQMHQRLFLLYLNPGLFLLLYILLQGIWAALFGRRSPRRVKNLIYDWGCSLKVPCLTPNGAKGQKKDTYTRAQRLQRWGFKYFSLTVYLYAVFAAVLCLPVLVGNTLATEYWLRNIPTSETFNHIGAWAPLAATALIMFAVMVHHVQGHVWKNVKKITVQARMRPLHVLHEIGRRWRDVRTRHLSDTEKGNRPGLEESHRKKSDGPYPKMVRKTGLSALRSLLGPSNEVKDHINMIRNWLEKEWFYLKSFCKDPDDRRKFVPHHRTDHHEKWKGAFNKTEDILRPLSAQSSQESIQLESCPNKSDPAPTRPLVASSEWESSSRLILPEANQVIQGTDSSDITDSARPLSYKQTPSTPVRQPSRHRTSSPPNPAPDSSSERQSLLSPFKHSRRRSYARSSNDPARDHHPAASSPFTPSPLPPAPCSTTLSSTASAGTPSSSGLLTPDLEMQHLLSPSPSASSSGMEVMPNSPWR